MKHGVVYEPPAVVATPARAPPSLAIVSYRTECTVRPGPGQVALVGAAPGTDVQLAGADGSVVRDDDVDLLGSLLFRNLDPGDYTLRSADHATAPFTVPGFDE